MNLEDRIKVKLNLMDKEEALSKAVDEAVAKKDQLNQDIADSILDKIHSKK